MIATITELDDFTRAYLEAILWAETDNADDKGGEPLDANYDLTTSILTPWRKQSRIAAASKRKTRQTLPSTIIRNGVPPNWEGMIFG